MKRVILIGDSIRIGYEKGVAERLAGQAEVHGPAANGGNSRKVLENLAEWALAKPADVIHLNCGLHDLRREFGAPNAVPLEEYAANVARILGRLKAESKAAILWATTTPVNETWHHAQKGFDRFEADVDAYNLAAVRAAQKAGVPVNDLYTAVQQAGRDRLLKTDGVHFNPDGCALLSRAVADAVRPYLKD
jgi:lysophospholipase L1-like esterase